MTAALRTRSAGHIGTAALVALVSVAFTVMAIPNLLLWARVADHGIPEQTDYLAFAAGGRLAREAPDQLYDLPAQRRAEQALSAEAPCCPAFVPFVNPPHVAVAYGALTAEGFRAGYVATALVNLTLVAGLLVAVHHLVRPLAVAQRALVVAATAASGPVAAAMYQGGPSSAAALGITLTVVGDRRRSTAMTAVGLLLVTSKPHFLLLPLLWLAVRGRWRAIGAFGLMGAATVVATLPLVGFGPWLRYPGAILHYSDPGSGLEVDPRHWWNIVGSLPTFGVDHRAGWLEHVGWTAFAIAAVALGLFTWRRARHPAAQAPLAAALLACGILAVPHANPHDALVIGPAFALALTAGLAGRAARLRTAALLTLLVLWPLASTASVVTHQRGILGHLPVLLVALLGAISAGAAWTSGPRVTADA